MQPSFLSVLLFSILFSFALMGLIFSMALTLIAHDNFARHLETQRHNVVLIRISIATAWMIIIFMVLEFLCMMFLEFSVIELIKYIWTW